jgi:arylsulfatase A-like enzyme
LWRISGQQKPNILVIMADDIGYWNISAYRALSFGQLFHRCFQIAAAVCA